MNEGTKLAAGQAPSGYYTGEKAEYVRGMFAGIAGRYDLLNSVLSLNRHGSWRRAATHLAQPPPSGSALDVCAGTGDFAVELYKAIGEQGCVIASDFCAPMLKAGRQKTDRASGSRIKLMLADALRLPFESNRFDVVTVGFGIRNVSDITTALKEMTRVAKPGGKVVCLEFNRPRSPFWRAVCAAYESRILPFIGSLLSKREAYRYLHKSIQAFHTREELETMMREAGLNQVTVTDLNFGSVCIHIGVKP